MTFLNAYRTYTTPALLAEYDSLTEKHNKINDETRLLRLETFMDLIITVLHEREKESRGE